MRERLVIANTSPLFYLHQVGHLEVLRALYGRIVIPVAVQAELAAGGQAGFATPDISRAKWIEVRPVRSKELIPAVVDLGPGEAEVLALGLEHPGSLLILDDRLGRRVAHLNSLTYTGTVGVLVKAKQAGHLKEIRGIVQQLRESGLWLTDDLVTMVLDQANE
jgi:predicted nucleic acid-binding protein